nr:glycosyltransferase [Mycolicibacterium komanii]CRL69244.1 glycosyltransferase [Mycolicibacterium komanii]
MKGAPDRAYLKPPSYGSHDLPEVRPLAIMIVAQPGHDELEMCLVSVAEHLPDLPVFVYVDADDQYWSHHELMLRFPAVHWVPGSAHSNFAAAFNALVERAPRDADLLLLRTDSRIAGPLHRTRRLVREPHTAAVSPLIYTKTTPDRPSLRIARRPSLIRSLLAPVGRPESMLSKYVSTSYTCRPSESQDVDGYLDSPCLAINRAAWNAVGDFDEEFSGCGETADWQCRARTAGWRIKLAAEPGVEHDISVGENGNRQVGSDEEARVRDLERTNTALLIEHHQGVRQADLYLAGTSLADRLRRPRPARRRPATATKRNDLPAVVIITNRLVYGGAERQKALLATELDRRGYRVTVVCVQRFGPVLNEIPPTVRVVRQPWWAPVLDIPAGPAVLVSGDTNTETGFGTLWRAGSPDRRWLVAAHVPPVEDGPIYSRALTAAMSRADGFIVLAHRHWEMLIAQHRLRGPYFVAPNGVPLVDDPPTRIRNEDEPTHLVMLSRIVEHKNPHVLIEALSQITDMPWRLSIYGDGPDRDMLEARTPDPLRDRVLWRGWSPGPGPALADADLLCVPSRSEAFPLVILEAMARKVPVAASAVCAVPEMLDFGKAGYLVEPVSVSGWRNRLAGILRDPAALAGMGERGYHRMRTHYTVQAMTDAYVDAIQAVL